jgi:hypothetical protein
MEKAIIIKATGEKSVVEFDEESSYKVLSGAVGGFIERVQLKGGLDLWLNEEGKLTGLPQNPIGTGLWSDSYGTTDIIVGNIIITSGTDDEGNTLGLSDEQVAHLMAYDRAVWMLDSVFLTSFE